MPSDNPSRIDLSNGNTISQLELATQFYSRGVAELQRENIVEGMNNIKLCASLAHGGCAEILGWYYYKGEHVEKDLEQAEKWEKIAWSTGIKYIYAGLSGALSLAEYYCDESYFGKSKSEILDWAKKAEKLLLQLLVSFSRDEVYQSKELIQQFLDRIESVRNNVKNNACPSLQS